MTGAMSDPGTGSFFTPTQIQVRSSDLQTTWGTASTTDDATKTKRIGGASIWNNNGTYYLYITRESGFDSAYIQRFNVTDPQNQFCDTLGTNGTSTCRTRWLSGLPPGAGSRQGRHHLCHQHPNEFGLKQGYRQGL